MPWFTKKTDIVIAIFFLGMLLLFVSESNGFIAIKAVIGIVFLMIFLLIKVAVERKNKDR